MSKLEILIVALAAVLLLAAVGGLLFWRRRPRALKIDYYQEQWLTLQKGLRDKTKWPEAVVEADKLLDNALKRMRMPGRNMGERMVKAQRLFTDNDGVWFGHKLRNKIDANPTVKLKEADVKQALIGIRQALKDLGALPDVKPRSSK